MATSPSPFGTNDTPDGPNGPLDLERAKRAVIRGMAVVVVLMTLSYLARDFLRGSGFFAAGDPAPAAVPPRAPESNGYWQVTDTSYGPIRFDDSVDVTEPHVGSYFQAKQGANGCPTIDFPFSPLGTEEITDGTVVIGVLVQSGKVETELHTQIGAREDDVRTAYAARGYAVSDRPADARSHDLIAARPRSAYELRFRIVKGKVASYSAGNAAEMENRERCRSGVATGIKLAPAHSSFMRPPWIP